MQKAMSDMMEGLAKLAEMSNRVEDGDYIGENGLLYCRNCNTPKQVKVNNPFIPGRVDTRFCLCKCKVEEAERERREQKRLEIEIDYRNLKSWGKTKSELLTWINAHDYKISKTLAAERITLMREICFGEDDLSGWTFENANSEKAIVVARNYVDNFDTFKEQGKGVIFYGDVGTGKSYAAACIANALIDKGVPVHMTNFSRIADTAQGMFEGRQDYYDSFNRFPLLILDDLAAERKTEFMQEIVFKVIDTRIRSGLPLIVTTNLTSDELKNPSDITYKRTYSRLLEMCHPVKVEGADKRKQKLKKGFDETNKLLGL